MKPSQQRGQMLSEFLMCLSIAVLLWIVLVKIDGKHNVHNKIKASIEGNRALIEAGYPALNLSQYTAPR